jgi:hypothetical protein
MVDTLVKSLGLLVRERRTLQRKEECQALVASLLRFRQAIEGEATVKVGMAGGACNLLVATGAGSAFSVAKDNDSMEFHPQKPSVGRVYPVRAAQSYAPRPRNTGQTRVEAGPSY